MTHLLLEPKVLANTGRNTLLAAWDDNRLIGNQNKLPWYLKDDMAFFKKTTMDHSLVMGRSTWESIGSKPLPGRENIVVSKTLDPRTMPDGSVATPDLNIAIELAHLAKDKYDIFIIGGAQIYRSCLNDNLVDRMIITHVHGVYEGDVYFPEFNEGEWNITNIIEENNYTIKEYNKK